VSHRTESIRARRGFTLIELLVVIAIIATLAAVVAPSIFGNVGDARQSAAKAQIQILSLALDAYRLDTFDYPSTAEGLVSLRAVPARLAGSGRWRGPYLRQDVPLDPWGRPYAYTAPGIANPTAFDLHTLGRDGVPGGDGEDADVTSWGGAVRQ
jgi:general secretion pathway protein G